MTLQIRPATADDAAECGRICHDAFAALANHHRFPPDFPSVEVATGLVSMMNSMTIGLYQEPRGAYLVSVSF